MIEQKAVPFLHTGNGSGMLTDGGQIICMAGKLVVEFERKDANRGLYHTTVETVEVPLEQILSLEFEKRWFSARLVLRARQISAIDRLPGRKGSEWMVAIQRRDQAAAQDLVSTANLLISEIRLNQLGDLE
jgi:hypothetical protein